MGWMRDVKASKLQNEAVEAFNSGRQVFMAVLKAPATRPNLTGEVLDWSLMVQAVEDAGWMVATMSGTASEAVVCFKRLEMNRRVGMEAAAREALVAGERVQRG